MFKRKKENETNDSSSRWLIVGLGNPGETHELTWHNAGFMCLDMLSQENGIKINKIKFKGIYGTGKIYGNEVILLKPVTYMNKSGESIREASSFYKIPPEKIIVIYDDIDINLGTIRIRINGGAGTHNGMRSVIESLKTLNFPRIRIGIGPPPPEWDLAGYVLSKIPDELQESMFETLRKGRLAIEEIFKSGIKISMNQYNGIIEKQKERNIPEND